MQRVSFSPNGLVTVLGWMVLGNVFGKTGYQPRRLITSVYLGYPCQPSPQLWLYRWGEGETEGIEKRILTLCTHKSSFPHLHPNKHNVSGTPPPTPSQAFQSPRNPPRHGSGVGETPKARKESERGQTKRRRGRGEDPGARETKGKREKASHRGVSSMET